MKNYYINLAIFGIFLELVLIEWMIGLHLKKLLENFRIDQLPFLFAIIVGLSIKIYLGYQFDKKGHAINLKQTLIRAFFIFVCGVFAGSMANVIFIIGFSTQTFFNDFFDYGIKPLYWLSVVGIPASVIVGLIYKGSINLIKAYK